MVAKLNNVEVSEVILGRGLIRGLQIPSDGLSLNRIS